MRRNFWSNLSTVDEELRSGAVQMKGSFLQDFITDEMEEEFVAVNSNVCLEEGRAEIIVPRSSSNPPKDLKFEIF